MAQQEAVKRASQGLEGERLIAAVTLVNPVQMGPFSGQFTLRTTASRKANPIAGTVPNLLVLEDGSRGVMLHWVDVQKRKHTFFIPDSNIVWIEFDSDD